MLIELNASDGIDFGSSKASAHPLNSQRCNIRAPLPKTISNTSIPLLEAQCIRRSPGYLRSPNSTSEGHLLQATCAPKAQSFGPSGDSQGILIVDELEKSRLSSQKAPLKPLLDGGFAHAIDKTDPRPAMRFRSAECRLNVGYTLEWLRENALD
ncbi:uncharacterized protein FOMMEDRAFT_162287 [Fomitiporia mediterranea MF3/22]|uniref:uncharacterized protein n=1 Tax=Fomitiporia mediterranea (strain MF3/22) TaxID=694068 RepID=UPI0004409001|nr:uncharacterized protein FOMMEDRAFT_162287 [Fomitiporia mediterranea MF3/22]EJC97942.1 hypothetical protein FOMMEDRAFT_162287 [Fomitiporia mediterranea MF3/22]